MYEKSPSCSFNSFVESDTVDDIVLESDENQDQPEESAGQEYFEEYEWMSEQEIHDAEYMRQLEEEELINRCLEEMDRTVLLEEIHEVQDEMGEPYNHLVQLCMAVSSKLNPFAKEFVPGTRIVEN